MENNIEKNKIIVESFWNDSFYELEEDNLDFIVEKNTLNEDVIVIKENEEYIYLNSIYDIDKHTEVWAEQHNITNAFTIAVIYGLSDGRYISKLREKNKDMLIIAYEPSVKLAKYTKKTGILDNLKSDNTIILCGNNNFPVFVKIIETVINYSNQKYIKYFISPNYERIYEEDTKKTANVINDFILNQKFGRTTKEVLGRPFLVNTANNIIDCVEQYSITDYVEILSQLDKKNIPAIIVSAGPSLDNNINELKNAVGKSYIIAVDTALNPLAKADIMPDVAVTVDPEKPIELFSNPKMVEVPLIYQLLANKDIRKVHLGKRIYQHSISSPLNVFYKKYGKKTGFLETGGSVANNAYSLAQQAGFETIIFIGQDLAYPNDQEHASDAFGEDYNNFITNNGKTYFYVEDNYGGRIKTESSMNKYRLWFEKEVMCHPEIRFINATEGGAKINGMEFMTLKDAISVCCNNNININFSNLANEIVTAFNQEEKKDILKFLADYEDEIRRLKKKLRDGISLYDKLEEYNMKQNYTGKGFENTFNKISELNKWVVEGDDVSYLSNYAHNNEYEVLETVLDEKESVYDEINFLVSGGRKTLNGLIDAADVALADLKDTIELAKQKLKQYGNDGEEHV